MSERSEFGKFEPLIATSPLSISNDARAGAGTASEPNPLRGLLFHLDRVPTGVEWTSTFAKRYSSPCARGSFVSTYTAYLFARIPA